MNTIASVLDFVKNNSHSAKPPYDIEVVKQNADISAIVHVTPIDNPTESSTITIWIDGVNMYFEDRDIKWPIDDPSTDLGVIALTILEDTKKLHLVAQEAERGRSILSIASTIKTRADFLKNELSKTCKFACAELYTQLAQDKNVQSVGYTAGAPVEEILIYLHKPPEPNDSYPTIFKGFVVSVKVLGASVIANKE